MQHYWLDLLFFLVFDRKELSIQDSSLCMEFVPFALNLMGLLLQIEGVIIGGYAVRRLIFRKGYFWRNFDYWGIIFSGSSFVLLVLSAIRTS